MYVKQQIWKHFRVVRHLDMGGMAEILQVQDERNHTFVAKVLRDDRLEKSPRFLEQFRHEAAIHPTLKHPNIVRCFDTFDRPPGLLLDYMPGGSLRQAMQPGSRLYSDSNLIMHMLHQLTDALTYLHTRQRIVHCDLKPENILMDGKGKFLLTDFGISQPLGQKPSSQRGTPKYMAPEQYLTQPLDERTDVYSLAITMYEILTGGQPPFTTKDNDNNSAESKQRELEDKHINVRPPLPSYMRQDIRPEIDAVLLRALEKKPVDRYTTVQAFFEALHQAFSRSTTNNLSMSATKERRNMDWLRHTMPQAHIVCTTGQLQRPVSLEPVTLMGRKRECNVPLRGNAISRRHAMIEWDANTQQFLVYDQGSLIGTRVNGQLLQEARALARGDLITIGGYNFRFEG